MSPLFHSSSLRFRAVAFYLNYSLVVLFLTLVIPTTSLFSQFSSELPGGIPTGKNFVFSVEKEGFVRVPVGQLLSLGVSILELNKVNVLGNGSQLLTEKVQGSEVDHLIPQPIIVEKDNSGSITGFVFYVRSVGGARITGDGRSSYFEQHLYETKGSYLLNVGALPTVTAVLESIPKSDQMPILTRGQGFVHFEEELVNPYGGGSGKRWFGYPFDAQSSRTLTATLDGLLHEGDIQCNLSVGHKAKRTVKNTDPVGSGVISIGVNGSSIATLSLGNYTGDYEEFLSASRNLTVGSASIGDDNRFSMKLDYLNQYLPTAICYVDYLNVIYPRGLTARENEISFQLAETLSVQTAIAIDGMTSGAVYCVEVSDPAKPMYQSNQSSVGNVFEFVADSTSSLRQFFVGDVKLGVILSPIEIGDLRNPANSVDAIVITSNDLEGSAKSFGEYRSAKSSMRVKVVTLDAIYREFNAGVKDIVAIRDFLHYALSMWSGKLKYVVLWGDGHYDYKNISTSTPNSVPAYESAERDGSYSATSTYTTDDFYGRVVGNDDLVDLGIGRVPLRTDAAGYEFLDKIKNYENSSSHDYWRSIVTQIADDSPTSLTFDGAEHTNSINSVSDAIDKNFQENKLYMAEFPNEFTSAGRRKPRVTESFLSIVNSTGTLFMNWMGHGNPRVWAHEFIFDKTTTIGQMNNPSKNFFLTAATCDFGRFDMTDDQSGAEELVLKKDGGAIGVFSSSRLVFTGSNRLIAVAFYGSAFANRRDTNFRLGDVVKLVKQRHFDNNDEKFFLLGDPTMRLHIPSKDVAISLLNEVPIDEAMPDSLKPMVKALSTVRLKGEVRNADKTVDEAFNGNVYISLYDNDLNYFVSDIDNSRHQISKVGGTLNKTTARVVKGVFSAEFVIPKDISYSNLPGSLYCYASSTDDGRSAVGRTKAFRVGGIDVTGIGDVDGPTIQAFMDSRLFQDGGLVRSNPMLIVDLSDNSGINSTGAGVGHKIEGWLDDSETSIDLTPFYAAVLDDPKKGVCVKQLLGLTPGTHVIVIRAWDVANNPATTSIKFFVKETDESLVQHAVAYPNPVSKSATIQYNHNMQAAFTALLKIFDSRGREVRTISKYETSMQSGQFAWDGLDNYGTSVADGSYWFRVITNEVDGNEVYSTGQLIFLHQ